MGVTIHYRGSLDDLDRVEDFEDRVLDMALSLGGEGRIWRSACDTDPARIVQGLIVSLAPGQESLSLLISPEGRLVNLCDIEAAELGQVDQGVWCFVKTQFGSVEGHVAVAELLMALKKQFISDLEVNDEGGYWEHRDWRRLQETMDTCGAAIRGLATALENDNLSPEAAEDPEILATRIERIARQVHKTIARPSEHAPVTLADEPDFIKPDLAEEEARYDKLYEENRRKSERIRRKLEELVLQGEDVGDALEAAIDEVVGLPITPPDFLKSAEEDTDLGDSPSWADDSHAAEEPWASDDDGENDDFDFDSVGRHPLLERATQLYLRLMTIAGESSEQSNTFDTILMGAGNLCGGLAQVLSANDLAWEEDQRDVGRVAVQLKRALRGAGFVLGGIASLGDEVGLEKEARQELFSTVQDIQTEIVGLLQQLRNGRSG